MVTKNKTVGATVQKMSDLVIQKNLKDMFQDCISYVGFFLLSLHTTDNRGFTVS